MDVSHVSFNQTLTCDQGGGLLMEAFKDFSSSLELALFDEVSNKN